MSALAWGAKGRPFKSARPDHVLLIGVFDGVHRGHQLLLQRARALARRDHLAIRVLTFTPHPEAILRKAPPLLQTLPDRLAALRAHGASECEVLTFTPALAAISPEEFLRRFVRRDHGVRALVVGENFTFGRGGKRNVALLKEHCRQEAILLERVPALRLGGERVSSSRIRRLLRKGAVKEAAELLGKPWKVRAQRVAGSGRGKKLGFPTINLRLPRVLVEPAYGVYFVEVRPGGLAVANFGVRPTFGGGMPLLEVHFPGSPPQEEVLEVAFLHFHRPEHRFPEIQALQQQIQRDLQAFQRWRANIVCREQS